MFKSKAMNALIADLATKKTAAQALLNKEGVTAEDLMNAQKEIATIEAKISVQETVDKGKEFDANGDEVKDMKPANTPLFAEAKDHKGPFNSFGEQLRAIVSSSRQGAEIDNRLLAVQNASGANEGVPSEGGFLVQQDFSTELIQLMHDSAVLAPRCRSIPISANSNSVKMNGIEETSRATGSRWGGVRGYWANEAATVAASQPKFNKIELTLNKLMAIYYATDEVLQDSSAMESILSQAFAEELSFMREDAIIRGTGAGQPKGILNSGALISVAKETNQTADTIVYENILNMWSRLIASSRNNAVWYINQEIEKQLYTMYLAIGTGGVPVYMPANGVAGQPYGTLFGRPVMPIEQCAALGDKGDIILADLSQYLLADKGGVQTASSMHVKFLYDEMAFRVTYRVDGQTMRNSPLTPYKGANTLSSFVTLDARA